MQMLNPLDHPVCLEVPHRLTPGSAWHEHIPFAMLLVDLLRPKTIVELGTYSGDSYCAFCQAVKALDLETSCYAVDTWAGDPHAGLYGPEVLADLRAHHDPLYASFSRLMQSTFDEAVEHFTDGEIDLLHIDGYHAYQAIVHDFETWLPKMSERGVVLLHDINVRQKDFGIGRFWKEVKARYHHFELLHGHGLGLIAVGDVHPEILRDLLDLSPEDSVVVRDFFFQQGHRLTTQVRTSALASELEDREKCLRELKDVLQSKDAYIANLEIGIEKQTSHLNHLETSLHQRAADISDMEFRIEQIQRGIVMQFLGRYQGVVERVLRRGTRRRNCYELCLSGIRVILNEGWQSFFTKARYRLSQMHSVTNTPSVDLPRFKASISREEAGSLAFPVPSAKPEVSIIVPVHNNWRYTLNCLKSIRENTTGDYELVVVDDASTDETPTILSKISNVLLLSNEENSGFVESCNRGAKASRGKYIIFLNNDTLVTAGWLQSLLETAKRENVGAVGAKLVYPDGTLQEAGGIVWASGYGHNYGRGDRADRPEYNYAREVDYCSGACLLVKKSLFEKLGGFDKAFGPGYYEDTDLCFSIRRIGYRVVYQPMSVVVHFEGVTCGTDLRSGVKRFQEVNRQRFVDRWGSVLRDQYPSAPENLFLARDRWVGNRILVIDQRVPQFDRDSGSCRMTNILRILADLGHKVTLLGADMRGAQPYTRDLQGYGIEVVYAPYVESPEEYIREFGGYFQLFVLSRPYTAVKYIDMLKKRYAGVPVIYDTVDLAFLRLCRRAEVEDDEDIREEAERTRSIELYLARSSSLTLVVSDVERETLMQMLPSLRVEVVSNIHHITEPKKQFSEREGILFIGGFDHMPNIDAVRFFVDEVLPIVRRSLPGIHFYVVGNIPSPHPAEAVMAFASEDVTVTGYVPDLTTYLENCRVFVAPLRYGAGVKGKINQSMSHGLPVVTTSVGAEGAFLADGESALIADDAKGLADKIVLLYKNERLWKKLSRNSIANIEDHFSYAIAKERLDAVIDNLTGGTLR